MKPSRNSDNKQSKQGFTNKPKPDIRDDMDSRENKELNFKDKQKKKPGKKSK